MVALGLMSAGVAGAQDSPAGYTPPRRNQPATITETLQGRPDGTQNGNNGAGNMQNSGGQMGGYGGSLSGNASIAAAGNYVYIFRNGRLYQLSNAGLTLISRKNIGMGRASMTAFNSRGAAGATGFHRTQNQTGQNSRAAADIANAANGGNGGGLGYHITTEGGTNGPGVTANSQSSPTQASTSGQGVVIANGTVNPNQVGSNQGAAGSGANAYGSMGMMPMGMGFNSKVAAAGNYVYVLDGDLLYELRAADLTIVSRRDLRSMEYDNSHGGRASGNYRNNSRQGNNR
jgi:hypothetical protein